MSGRELRCTLDAHNVGAKWRRCADQWHESKAPIENLFDLTPLTRREQIELDRHMCPSSRTNDTMRQIRQSPSPSQSDLQVQHPLKIPCINLQTWGVFGSPKTERKLSVGVQTIEQI